MFIQSFLTAVCAVTVSATVIQRDTNSKSQANHRLSHSLCGGKRPESPLQRRQNFDDCTDPSCTNGPESRQCWYDGWNINTDFDTNWPDAGCTRQYHLDITNGTAAPDGVERPVLLVNGKYMGPTIYADWGDWVEVTLTNNMQDNGTGIHWHGIRQWHTNTEDGVPGLTECPLAPGQSKVYRWRATQYGTSW